MLFVWLTKENIYVGRWDWNSEAYIYKLGKRARFRIYLGQTFISYNPTIKSIIFNEVMFLEVLWLVDILNCNNMHCD